MRLRQFVMGFCVLAFAALISFPVKADENDKLTYFTFSAPVELPGVTLPAGTYMFKLLDGINTPHVVQVFDKQGTKHYATILAIPDYRQQPSEKTIIKFSETAAGGPPAVKEWFYPGDNFGQEFVYPKNRAVQLAKAANQPVPSMPQEMASHITEPAKSATDAGVVAMKNSPVKAEQPTGEEVDVSKAFLSAPPAASSGANTTHHINTD